MTEHRRHVVEPISITPVPVGTAERRRVAEVLASGRLSSGPETDAFAAEFAAVCDVDHAVATASSAEALHATFTALDVGRDDVVVTSPFAFPATITAIRQAGARPAFADVEAATYTVDPTAAERVLRARDDVAAILVTHRFGLPAAMRALSTLAEYHDVALIEDASRALGASYRCRPVGSLGDAACFSFDPASPVTTGAGGMVVTDRSDLAGSVERALTHGHTDAAPGSPVGPDYCMSEIQAAMGRAQVGRVDDDLTARRENAARLDVGLASTDLSPPTVPIGRRHAYAQYTVRPGDVSEFRSHMRRFGVETAMALPPLHVPGPDSVDEVHADRDHSATPTAETVASTLVSVPVHAGLDDDVRTIRRGLSEWRS